MSERITGTWHGNKLSLFIPKAVLDQIRKHWTLEPDGRTTYEREQAEKLALAQNAPESDSAEVGESEFPSNLGNSSALHCRPARSRKPRKARGRKCTATVNPIVDSSSEEK